ncbi:MAG: TonB-dependent receptor [Saprospiraceae bacterium]|jgi:outer membrane receptor protein involved in Fe transport|nr:TonB-dependent receptor [Saprospiraceae bacterium]
MKFIFLFLFSFVAFSMLAQNASIKGQLQDENKEAVVFANVALYNGADSSLVKVEPSDDSGIFNIKGLVAGNYYLVATYVGVADLRKSDINLAADQALDLGIISFAPSAIELEEATVTASRVMVEVKPDRTVFNVDGTINSVGSDAIELLRKAPGVLVDNNNNLSVLGRSGVMIYVDGKRLPLAGDDLANYLQNLPAEQIDRIDIITNPGARYEAEGNAGIIDIRLKKDKRFGSNGSLSTTATQGRYFRGNTNLSGNYRNKLLNAFATAGFADGTNYNDMNFNSLQNNLSLDEINLNQNKWQNYNYRLGTDFFLGERNTIGFLVSGNQTNGESLTNNNIQIAQAAIPTQIDSVLFARSTADDTRIQNTVNLNYRYTGDKGRSFNIDLDYGRYENRSDRFQDNEYFNEELTDVLTQVVNGFETPTDIDIYTFKADYEEEIWGGKLGVGTKLSRVVSDNTFLVFDIENGVSTRNDRSSNIFDYEENVYAGYINFARPLGQKWNFSAGLRAEQTDATGNLQAFLQELMEDPVDFNYLSWFPSIGFTYQMGPQDVLSINYGRRINRPDYNVLNPFNNQLSQLSFEKGNPFLSPEIVNNFEIGYVLGYRYNFKLAHSITTDQITRLIAPDEDDPRASFISWDNLSEQQVTSFNFSAPVQINKWWFAYMNATASYTDNQADYGDGAVVDVQAFSYNFFVQNTFTLPWGLKGEISGWYSGPGVWGGVFEYDPTWSLNAGLQRKFLNDQLNVRLNVNDIFYKSGWAGVSEFNGLVSAGSGNWDSRQVSLSLSYSFGNQNVKSRKRKTGLEEEAGRVGGGN